MTNLQLGMVALIAFLFGGLSAHLLPRVGVRLSTRRARRRVMQFVQPQGFGPPFPPLSETDAEDIGPSIDYVLRQREEACEAKTLRRLPHLGEKAPRCHEMTARVLALLDALCSCAWGCPGGDHLLERLVGRSVNHARAALRLALIGSYDEALVLARGVGEIANLLSLFEAQSGSFVRWKSLDERARRREFSPVRVRTELERIGTPMRIPTETYAELSGRNVHVGPQTLPQSYDILGRPKGGGYYQEAGFIVCQNELAQSLAFVIYSAAKLSRLDQLLKTRILVAGRDLVLHTGRLGVENIQEMWAELMRKSSGLPEQNPTTSS
jgi:hypothetical protein